MLKILDLSHSEQLVDISSISSAPKLESLLLEGCSRLLKCSSCINIIIRVRTNYFP